MSARIEWVAGFLPNMGGKALGIGYEEEIAPCLSGQLGGVLIRVTYQSKTGCLTQGAHPGSYNGQDAYSDMLVTERKNVAFLERDGENNSLNGQKCRGGKGCLTRNSLMR